VRERHRQAGVGVHEMGRRHVELRPNGSQNTHGGTGRRVASGKDEVADCTQNIGSCTDRMAPGELC
jgi:hypothetical protein